MADTKRIKLHCRAVDKRGRACGRYLCTVVLLDPHPHVGPLVWIGEMKCPKCGALVKATLGIQDRPTLESVLRARVATRRSRMLPPPGRVDNCCR